MSRLRTSLPGLLLALVLLWVHAAAGQDAKTDGDARLARVWVGTLDVGAAKLRLVVELKRDDAGAWTGTMDSPDQQVFGIPLSAAQVEDGDVKIELRSIGGSFTGKAADDGQQIAGEWRQGGKALPLVLKPGERSAPPRRPQTPQPPFPYDAEEVTYENAAAGVRLAGTLTKPRSEKPVPAVLLITGSGPQNRDEEMLGHKPFLVLADHLTRRGIAVLRVDDRGVGGSTGGTKGTTADFVGDVLAGVAYLGTRRDVDPARIGLIGHSEGGLIAPAAAAQSPHVAFIVLMAGPGVTGEEILYRQGDLIAAAAGANAAARAANHEVQKAMIAVAKTEPDDARATAQIRAALGGSPDKPMSAAVEAQIRTTLAPWFRYFLTYDPRPALEKVRCPVLALNGSSDLQVDPQQNLPAISAALKAGKNPDATVTELRGLNHLFQPCKTGGLSEYGQIETTIDPAALKLMGDWIVERFVAK